MNNYTYEPVIVSPTSMFGALPYLPTKARFRPGDRLRVKRDGYDHIGTYGYDGLVYAASRKFRGVSKVTLEQFSGGREILNDEQVGPLLCRQIIANYEALLGRPYNLLSANCEHYDNWARGLGWKSEQVDLAKDVALLTALASCAVLAGNRAARP